MKSSAVVLQMPGPDVQQVKARRDRGTGRVWLIGNVWWIQYYSRGRQVRESSHSPKKQVAQELLTKRLADKIDGSTPISDARTLRYADMRNRLYAHYETNNLKSLLRHKVDGKMEGYLGTVAGDALDDHFKDCVAADITDHRLMTFIKNRQRAGKSNATINRSLQALKHMFKLAVKAKQIPALAVPEFPKLKEPRARRDFLTPEEYQKVFAQAPDYLKPLFAVAYHTGMRKSELLSRKWEHVDFEAGLIRLNDGETKNDEGRVIPMIGPVAALLHDLRATNPDAEYVFTHEGKRILDFRRAWRTALKKAGLAVGIKNGGHTFHGNRRSMATNLLEAGVDEQSAQQITGHIDKDMLRRYRQLREHNAVASGKKLEKFLNANPSA